ncbi:MAG: hypothetical protein MAG453_01605 [Calditrichaeota bacterium]|nr:hypothetical protein [Calditrichota bacterium]
MRWILCVLAGAVVIALAAGPVAAQVTLMPHEDTLIVPPEGGDVAWDIVITNPYNQLFEVDLWTFVTAPGGGVVEPLMLIEGAVFNEQMEVIINNAMFPVPGWAPSGQYSFTFNIGTFPVNPVIQRSFTFEKQAGGDNEIPHGVWPPPRVPSVVIH